MVSWEREARTLGTPHPAQSPPRGGAVAHTSVCLLGTERERERTRSTSALALVGVVHQRDRSAERRRRPPLTPHTHTLRTDPRSRTSGPQTPRTTRPVYARNARSELPPPRPTKNGRSRKGNVTTATLLPHQPAEAELWAKASSDLLSPHPPPPCGALVLGRMDGWIRLGSFGHFGRRTQRPRVGAPRHEGVI